MTKKHISYLTFGISLRTSNETLNYSGSGNRWQESCNPLEGDDYTWYASGFFSVNWVIICYQATFWNLKKSID